ncbi:MAG: LLM class flavin-dependent oxidoreductase [Acidimicrobiales bacterium]
MVRRPEPSAPPCWPRHQTERDRTDLRVGITLPQFRADADEALAVARRAEAAGLDGVFVFDHLWPIGQPDRPALHGPSLLAAVATETTRIAVGTLVARVGLLPDDVLIRGLNTVAAMAGKRLIAGLGIGDRLSRTENRAYGVPFPPAGARRAALVAVCRRLRALGIETWIGGLSAGTRAVARSEADAVNLWGVEPSRLAAEPAGVPVTWGGQVDLATTDVTAHLAALAGAGATWAVVAPLGAGWPAAVELLGSAREVLR